MDAELRECIEACFARAPACTACADACLSEDTVTELAKCIRADTDRADDADMHEHCRICAEACRRCETACREPTSSLG